ncbi:NACHT domain-containing protein [Fusarium falciforme]|uniref:NACHT domain-containing protein n=1 Tax=Fusarium falciforme TaxID=195108 RepID=UPI002300727A|nr:NACHT domain-containing protein [Fusarium falciforme]WAO86263.1 NACHT domain-containing protein [Fusarium falciforme]
MAKNSVKELSASERSQVHVGDNYILSPEDNKCMIDLRGTDPRRDKDRIEELKGGLLAKPCDWVFADACFAQWRNPQSNRLLWIKADSGKGKTMLLCSIINWLQINEEATLAYFFCQKSDENLSSSAAVLRGLVYMLAREHGTVRELVQDEYKNAGRSLFCDHNAWYALKEILSKALHQEGLGDIVIIVDALDECMIGIHQLLNLVAKFSSETPRVKWIVSSRNESDIEQHFDEFMEDPILRIELGASSEAASFRTYLQSKVDELAEAQCYGKETKMAVKLHLERNANANLHWVTLACQTLERARRGQAIDTVHLFPPGLDNLYLHLFRQILESFGDRPCQKVLAFAAVVSRPISLTEFSCLAGIEKNETVQLVGICHAFLTLQHETIYFVHQSAKDFLLSSSAPIEVAPTHREIIERSLQAMNSTLERDIYKLKRPGVSIDEFDVPQPDPLASIHYSCIFWADHLITLASEGREAISDLIADGGPVDLFLRQSFLNWVEALSLLKSFPSGVRSIARLLSLLEGRQDVTKPILLSKLVEDALRFMRFHQVGIENYPLQVYSAALIFSPSKSLIRQIFQNEEPRDILLKPHTGDYWSSVFSAFEGHDADVVAMSSSSGPKGTVVASASTDGTIKVWDANTGECFHTLTIPCEHKFPFGIFSNPSLESILLSLPEGSSDKLLSASGSTVSIWDPITGRQEGVLEHPSVVSVIALSFYNGTTTECVTLSTDWTVTVWDLKTRKAIKKIVIDSENTRKITLGPLSFAKFACSSRGNGRILIQPRSSGFFLLQVGPLAVWELETGNCLRVFEDDSTMAGTHPRDQSRIARSRSNIAFSPNGKLVATSGTTGCIRVWSVDTGECIHTLALKDGPFSQAGLPYISFPGDLAPISLAFTRTSAQLIWIGWWRSHGSLGVCSVDTGKSLPMLHVAGSYSSNLCVLGSSNNIVIADSQMINVIDPVSEGSEMPEGAAANQHVVISNNERYLAYFTRDNTLQIHDLGVPKLLMERTLNRRSDSMYFDNLQLWTVSFDPFSGNDDLPCQYLPGLLEPRPIPRHKYQIGGSWIFRDSEKHLWLPYRYRPSNKGLAHQHQDVRGSTLAVRWDPSNVYYLRFSNNSEEESRP